MKIQYCSDLHLEFPENKSYLRDNPIVPQGEILILAGDIMPFWEINNHYDFLEYISDNFKQTFWIPGNHEYYQYNVLENGKSFNISIRDNVSLVNNVSRLVDDVNFVFSTLWSEIDAESSETIKKAISDFYVIYHDREILTPEHFNELHKFSLDFIKNELPGKNAKKTIVATHHVPTFIHYPEKYKEGVLNKAFCVELSTLIHGFKPDYWIYGHHHENVNDFRVGETTLLTNQMGYVRRNEHLNFALDKVVVI